MVPVTLLLKCGLLLHLVFLTDIPRKCCYLAHRKSVVWEFKKEEDYSYDFQGKKLTTSRNLMFI